MSTGTRRREAALRPRRERLRANNRAPEPDPVDDLRLLYERVVEAKAIHRWQLGRRVNPDRIELTRQKSLAALEDFVGALSRHGLPVPPALHRDLSLLRGLCGGSRWRVPRGT